MRLFSLDSFVSDFSWRWLTQQVPSIFGIRLDHSTNDHHSQHRSADYLDCYFMTILFWENSEATHVSVRRMLRRSWGQHLSRWYWSYTQRNSSEELSRGCWQSYSCILIFMKFVRLDEFWSFRTKTSASDSQIYPGTFQSLWLLASCTWKIIAEGQLRILKPGMKLRKLRSKKAQKNKKSQI